MAYQETRRALDLCNILLNISKELYKYNNTALMYCFIHNMTFDLSYIRQPLIDMFRAYYKESFTLEEKFMSSGTRLYMRINNIEFRDSLNLYNNNLYNFTKDMNTTHKKLLGANDYGVHYSDETLPENFTAYQKMIVLAWPKQYIIWAGKKVIISLQPCPILIHRLIEKQWPMNLGKQKMEKK